MRLLMVLLFGLRAWAGSCEDIAKLEVAHVAIERAESVSSGRFLPQTGAPLLNLPPFCRIALVARVSSDSEIRIEIWMPEKNWNGRLEGTGNGGFAGRIGYSALANGVKLSYAVANTDMGMATPAKSAASIFVDRPERWADWGHRATHEMTVIAKQIVREYYDQPLKKSYFVGCSTGGEQALMEAQRFPDDYDGIVGGAPAHNRTGVHMSILWNFAVIEKDPGAYIPVTKLALLSGAALAACDEKDGVKDSVISDPSKCQFDPAVLQCTGRDEPTCLTRKQVETAHRLYAGPTNSVTGKQIYPGLPRGSEFGWDHLGPSPESANEPPYAPIFQWAFGPYWDWRTFDFGKSVGQFENKLATILNATSTNLDRFRSRGGKLILYHGWADWLVAPEETIRYYDDVTTRDQSLKVNTTDSLRLFMIPGMAHCGGGPGADQFDPLNAIVRWVESGKSPDNLVATKLTDGKPAFRRLLCPFPQTAAYRKKGDPSDDHSYACVNESTSAAKGSN